MQTAEKEKERERAREREIEREVDSISFFRFWLRFKLKFATGSWQMYCGQKKNYKTSQQQWQQHIGYKLIIAVFERNGANEYHNHSFFKPAFFSYFLVIFLSFFSINFSRIPNNCFREFPKNSLQNVSKRERRSFLIFIKVLQSW